MAEKEPSQRQLRVGQDKVRAVADCNTYTYRYNNMHHR